MPRANTEATAHVNLNDLINDKERELERLNDRISSYEDPDWIQDRKQRLVEKRDVLEQDLAILKGAANQLRGS